MNGAVWIFFVLGALAGGIAIGWWYRGRPEAAPDTDPEVELRELREVHETCGTKIRNLHIELSQLESALALAGVNRERQASAPPAAKVADATVGNGAAARLAEIIDALGNEEPGDDDTHGPAGFKSILPADLVEEGVMKAAEAESARAAITDVADDEDSGDTDEAVVISLIDRDDQAMSIAVGHGDDLKQIKGIGPKIESMLNDEGITTFQQIAELDDDSIARLDDVLGAFRGRIERDDWIGSARELISRHSISR